MFVTIFRNEAQVHIAGGTGRYRSRFRIRRPTVPNSCLRSQFEILPARLFTESEFQRDWISYQLTGL